MDERARAGVEDTLSEPNPHGDTLARHSSRARTNQRNVSIPETPEVVVGGSCRESRTEGPAAGLPNRQRGGRVCEVLGGRGAYGAWREGPPGTGPAPRWC